MKLPLWAMALWLAIALGQTTECTRELASSNDCADVIDPSACYNEYRFGARTLQCIEGKDDADRARKARDAPPMRLLRTC